MFCGRRAESWGTLAYRLLDVGEDRAEALNTVRQAIANNQPFQLEYRIRHKSGEIRHLQEDGKLLIRRSGLPHCIDGVIFKITDWKRSLEEVRKSEEKYRSLFDDSPEGIFITAMDGMLIDANQFFLDLFGYSREEIIGASGPKTYVNPEDRNRYVRNIEPTGFCKRLPTPFEKERWDRDGLLDFWNCQAGRGRDDSWGTGESFGTSPSNRECKDSLRRLRRWRPSELCQVVLLTISKTCSK